MAQADTTSLYYRLDDQNTIVGVGGGWDAAALDGRAPHLAAKQVIGANLFAHVTGAETALFLSTMLASARRQGMTRRYIYRCDTPFMRRTFEMTVEPDAHGDVVVRHALQTQVALRRAVFVREAHEKPQGCCQRCSFCNRMSVGGSWGEADDGVHSAPMTLHQPQAVYHVVCDDCYRDVYGDRAGPTLLASHRTIATTRRSVAASLLISGRSF